MLKSLVLINLRNLFFRTRQNSRKGKKSSIGTAVLLILLLLYAFGALTFMFGMMFYAMYEPFHNMGLDWFYFALAGIFSFMLCFVFSIFAAKTQMFEAGDNEFLLSMPIRPVTILASRILSLLALNYIYSAIIMIPAFVVYLIFGQLPIMGIISFVLAFLLLPLLALTFSCLFGWLLALITSKMRNKNIITMVFSLGFMALYFMGISRMQQYLDTLIVSGKTIADAVKRAVFPAFHMGNAIANGDILSLILFVIVVALPFILMILLLSRSFISITTSNKTAAKAVYKAKKLRASSGSMALFKKEWHHFISNPMYILNAALGSAFVIVVGVMAVINLDDLRELAFFFNKLSISVPLAASAVATMCASLNLVSAPSISLEGKSLWIAQTLPIQSKTILLSKAMLHFAITEPAVLISTTIFAVLFQPTLTELFLMYVFPTAFVAFCSLLGVVINLKFHRFDWVNETQVIKQSVSSFLSMFINMLSIILLGVLYFAVAVQYLSLVAFISLCSILFILLSVLFYLYLSGPGSKKFCTLQ